jgi:SAM-dependent methyltransferase
VRLNPYETRRYLDDYLLLHYGRPSDVCPFPFIPRELLRFHERLREEYLLPVRPRAQSHGLDLGCAVGRFSFELGRVVSDVIGLDNSELFVQAARRLARGHKLVVNVQESGAQLRARQLVLPGALRRCRVEFRVGDAMDLTDFPDGAFQVVSAINLICRMRHPRQCLRQLARLLAPGGQLLLVSPFSWLPQYSSPTEWLTEQDLRSFLHPHFRLVRHGDVPFVIREHRRKYELVISKAFTFVRRP